VRVQAVGSSASRSWVRALSGIAAIRQHPSACLGSLIDDMADKFGERPALASPDETLTYRGLTERKAQYAGWALQQGIPPGGVVCLLMNNRPDYVAAWTGLTQIGVIVALINTHLVGASLIHAINVAGATHVITDGALLPALQAARHDLPAAMQCWYSGDTVAGASGVRALELGAYATSPLCAPTRGSGNLSDVALLIYTSGTTGLPKAARISHYRIMEWSFWFAGMMSTGPDDRLYDCLPLYHSTGGVAGIGAMLVTGGCVEIRSRFSASSFWPDIVASGCTLFIYIGELCRYLMASPKCTAETQHNIRLCVGNGLSAAVWQPFVDRFRIKQVLEFYASTEGNVSLYNCEGRPGAIGRVPSFLAAKFPVALIACDATTGEAQRNADGYCIRSPPGTVGEAIGEIGNRSKADPTSFDGYTDASETERKILRHVFRQGDSWFRTGDLMMQDDERFFYFVDRIGDTFRWKGENVSTTEVAEAVCRCTGITNAIVYGVQVAGCDGRAGMAAVTIDDTFRPNLLHAEIAGRLPFYARPMFLRVCTSLKTTGTFKPIKIELAAQGFAEALLHDTVYIEDTGAATYRPLSDAEARGLQALTPHVSNVPHGSRWMQPRS
jgi:fatty-acyl-CoA synthase